MLKIVVEMWLLFIFYYSSSPYLTQAIIQTKDKYNENTHTEFHDRKTITVILLKILAFVYIY